MSNPSYFDAYENLAMSRDDDGVLTVRFHTAAGPSFSPARRMTDFTRALEEIALDADNRAMVITGTGDAFMDQIDGPSLGEIFKPAVWEKVRTEGRRCSSGSSISYAGHRCCERPGHGSLRVPDAVRHPYRVGPRRLRRLPASGIRDHGRDGVQVVWEELAGSARAKWLLWTAETIDAQTAKEWGVVNEVVAHDRASTAAWRSRGN